MPVYCGGLDQAAFAALPLGVRIRLAAFDFLGWRYSRTNNFPAARPGMPAGLARPGVPNLGIDCSSQGSYIVITATPKGLWTPERYGELQIFDAKQPWSPLDAVERAKVGRKVDAPVPGRWHVTQRWQDASTADGTPLSGGHFRVSYCEPTDPDLLFVIESTNRAHPAGGEVGPTWSVARVSELRKVSTPSGGFRCAVLDE